MAPITCVTLLRVSLCVEESCQQIVKVGGAYHLCCHLMDPDPSGQLLFSTIAVLWNLLESDSRQESVKHLSNITCIRCRSRCSGVVFIIIKVDCWRQSDCYMVDVILATPTVGVLPSAWRPCPSLFIITCARHLVNLFAVNAGYDQVFSMLTIKNVPFTLDDHLAVMDDIWTI